MLTEESAMEMRHAYAPIPQRTGLKRRWMPMGSSGITPKRTNYIINSMKNDNQSDNDPIQRGQAEWSRQPSKGS
jgi:hypothetical protein